MKTTSLIARYLLGLLFFVFGLNGFLHFIPLPPPAGLAGQFMGALYMSGELSVIMALQLGAGVLLLANRFVPLALVLITPFFVNSVAFHLFLEPSGLVMAAIFTALNLYLAWCYRSSYAVLLTARATPA